MADTGFPKSRGVGCHGYGYFMLGHFVVGHITQCTVKMFGYFLLGLFVHTLVFYCDFFCSFFSIGAFSTLNCQTYTAVY